MKLVAILARELEEWPDRTEIIVQDVDGRCWPSNRGFNPSFEDGCWSSHVSEAKIFHCETATDHTTAIVTRAHWEAERAKLKAHKANGDGWIRNRGRSDKCPVDPDALVQIVMRGESKKDFDPKPEFAKDWHWKHSGDKCDAMWYRIHKTAEQPLSVKREAVAEAVKLAQFKPDSSATADTMLAIRDRIRELDIQREEVESTYQRQISEITQERESLVQKLAGEGLALVEVVVDWRDWEKGDVVMCVSQNHKWSDKAELGASYRLSENPTMNDKHGLNVWVAGFYMNPADFKFVSRPAS